MLDKVRARNTHRTSQSEIIRILVRCDKQIVPLFQAKPVKVAQCVHNKSDDLFRSASETPHLCILLEALPQASYHRKSDFLA